jgi:hypothetical protein
MTQTLRRTARAMDESEQCFEAGQRLCALIAAEAPSAQRRASYAAELMSRSVERVLPPGDRALFFAHLARYQRAWGRTSMAAAARDAVAGRVPFAADVEPVAREWLDCVGNLPDDNRGRSRWLHRHLQRVLRELGIAGDLEGEIARVLAWHYLMGR